MQLGKVVGKVWATVKNPGLDSQRLLIVQPLTPEFKETGKKVICTDAVGVGDGELIYWCKGKEASFPFRPTEVPTEATIVAVVDEVHVPKAASKQSGEF
jgi:ethanolamine utilization protein EutN